MKRLLITLAFLAVVSGCASIGRESAIKAQQAGVRANDAQVDNLAEIGHAVNRANAASRLRAGDSPAVAIEDMSAIDRDIEQQRVNHADSNRVFDYSDIYMQSQRWWGHVLWRMARQAADNTTATKPAQ